MIFVCHTCDKQITKQEANICQSCYDKDVFCQCPQCERFRK